MFDFVVLCEISAQNKPINQIKSCLCLICFLRTLNQYLRGVEVFLMKMRPLPPASLPITDDGAQL